MLIAKVEPDQFRWVNNHMLTHTPTGTTFAWKYPHSDSQDLIIVFERAGEVLPRDEQFDPQQIEEMARHLMKVHDPS